MTPAPWVSIVALLGWLVLTLAALRARHVGARQAVTMGLGWLAIFLLVAAAFSYIRR